MKQNNYNVSFSVFKEEQIKLEVKLPSYFYVEYYDEQGNSEESYVKITTHTAWITEIKDKDTSSNSLIYNFKKIDFINTDQCISNMRQYFGINSSIFSEEISEEQYNIVVNLALVKLCDIMKN